MLVYIFTWRFEGINSLSSLRKKCLYLEFFWSVFSCVRTESEDLQSKDPYAVEMHKNKDYKNSEYGHIPRRVCLVTVNFLALKIKG